jgi:hypothetical protein
MKRGRTSPKYLTHDEDKALVTLALSGSNKAYNDLAQKYKPILYIAVRRRLPKISEEDAEDIVTHPPRGQRLGNRSPKKDTCH